MSKGEQEKAQTWSQRPGTGSSSVTHELSYPLEMCFLSVSLEQDNLCSSILHSDKFYVHIHVSIKVSIARKWRIKVYICV